jgi:DNA polymerase-3 subunit epsilon
MQNKWVQTLWWEPFGKMFIALDVETANRNQASICQVGLVWFDEHGEFQSWSSLVDPQTEFESMNVRLHGITPDQVRNAPKLPETISMISAALRNQIVLHHGSFDRIAFSQCYREFKLEPISCVWLDNIQVLKNVWSDLSAGGYALDKLANHFGIKLKHHDALSDAKAAGIIFGQALRASKTNAPFWSDRLGMIAAAEPGQPSGTLGCQGGSKFAACGLPTGQWKRCNGNADGPYAGATIVFTGDFQQDKPTMLRLAQNLGFDVGTSVTRKTDFLCVGTQSRTLATNGYKSAKQIKAEGLVRQGQQISILNEAGFWELAKQHLTGEI